MAKKLSSRSPRRLRSADEPEEGDTGERNEIELTGTLQFSGEPRDAVLRIELHRNPKQQRSCCFGFRCPSILKNSGSWLTENSSAVAVGLNLIPFAGISFLWFIGALRDRLGDREDRFFATVFFGSALLFLGGLFVASSLVGALLIAFAAEPNELLNSATLHFGHALAYNILNVYMVKMAAVFMITTSTVGISTKFVPRWFALLGYGLALRCWLAALTFDGVLWFSRCGFF